MDNREGYVPLQNGLKLYYRVVGDGPETVIIPNAVGLAADLEPLAVGRRVIFYDQRCRGKSDVDTDRSHTWVEYEAHDLEAVRRHFGLERMSVIGWSYMGAMVALHAATYPAHVERLVLMCAIPPRSEAPYNDSEARAQKENERIDPEEAKKLREMQQQGLDISDPETYCREFSRIITPRQMGKPDALARMRSDPCAFPNEWRHNIAKNFPPVVTEWDLRQQVVSAQMPTLVIHGEEDLIAVGASEEWAATLPDARLLNIPGSGHFPHLEAPEIYFPAVDQFLNGAWPAGAKVITEQKRPTGH